MSIKKGSKLAREIIGYIAVSGIISIFFYRFLLFASQGVVEVYCARNDMFLDSFQYEMMDFWIRRVSLVTAVVIFLFLCFFLSGQKFLYIRQIIHGVEALRENDLKYEVPVEGEDELTKLAESINYLAKSQRKLKEKELALKEEKETFIRALSHDIRTPLTSVLAITEYMAEKDVIDSEEIKDYLSLVKTKSAQMKILTDRLLNEGQRKPVLIENAKLLFEQLTDEWQEVLEAEFECIVSVEEIQLAGGEADVAELRRIFDNLASNVEKYAEPSKKVTMNIFTENEFVVIRQSNGIKEKRDSVESYGIGLQSIERLSKIYKGMMEVSVEEELFVIVIRLCFLNEIN